MDFIVVAVIVVFVAVVILWIMGRYEQQPTKAVVMQPQIPAETTETSETRIGEQYEIFVGGIYKKYGYFVYQKGVEQGIKDGGIDIVAKKDNKTILIQCKYWNNKRLDGITVRKFLGDCLMYVLKKQYNLDDVSFVMVIPPKCKLDYSAQILFETNKPRVRLKVIKMQNA